MRRILVIRMFYHFDVDSADETEAVMGTAPSSWRILLHWPGQPTSWLLAIVQRYEQECVGKWRKERASDRDRKWKDLQNRTVHLTDSHGLESTPESRDDDMESQTVNILSLDRDRSSHPSYSSAKTTGGRAKPQPPPLFPPDNSVVSKRPPPADSCLACSSKKHWARDCRHFGAWQLKSAQVAQTGEITQIETEEEKQAYLVMLTENDVKADTEKESFY